MQWRRELWASLGRAWVLETHCPVLDVDFRVSHLVPPESQVPATGTCDSRATGALCPQGPCPFLSVVPRSSKNRASAPGLAPSAFSPTSWSFLPTAPLLGPS